MGFGGGNASKGIQRQQQQQQALIDAGMKQLNAIFYGGSYGVNPASAFDPTGSYYTAQGTPYKFDPTSQDFLNWKKQYGKMDTNLPPKTGPDGKPATPQDISAQQQKAFGEYLAKQGLLYGGTSQSPGFGPQFYQQAQNAYLGYAIPQLMSQYGQTRKQLDYRLGNQGLLGSSAGRDLTNRLGNEAVVARQNIGNVGLGQAQQLQRDVNQQYSTLVGQLEASANPTATAQQALQAATQFSAPSALPAVGQLFNNFANQYLAGQYGGLYGQQAGMYGGYGSPYRNTGTGMNVPVATIVK